MYFSLDRIPSRASVIKEYGVYWDGINVTLHCKSSVSCLISLHKGKNGNEELDENETVLN